MRSLALVVSYVLHPLWVPLFLFLLLWAVDPWLRLQPAMMVYVTSILLINALAPAISIYALHRRGALSDLEASKRSERTIPFIVAMSPRFTPTPRRQQTCSDGAPSAPWRSVWPMPGAGRKNSPADPQGTPPHSTKERTTAKPSRNPSASSLGV